MFQRGVIAGLFGLLPTASALQGLPMSISQLAKKSTPRGVHPRQAAAYPEYNLTVPVDHFHNETRYEPHSDDTFNLRYWFDDQFYEPGGPVFVLSGGETSGADRLPFLEKGIVYEIAKATKGVGVILEHRYYGSSVPVDDFSTENLRFLSTEQALADTAYFAKNVEFEGLEDVDLSPETTPWIAYGGSYAGSFVAFLRIQYPDIYMGAISSSGVPKAIWDFYEYFEAARLFGPEDCIDATTKVVNVVDTILLNETDHTAQLKEVFGMGQISDDKDFASAISSDIYSLQSYQWDPELSSDAFFTYCDTVVKKNQYPSLEGRRADVEKLVEVAGYGDEADSLVDSMLNYIGSLGGAALARCEEGQTQNQCFGTTDADFYAQADLSQTWRLWPYQVCTEWGFLQTGSGYPADILPPISRLVDLEYSARTCTQTFGIKEPADVERVNKYGGFDIAYPRLAFVDGEWDPWRAAGVHAVSQEPARPSTPDQPMFLIDDAVHHWDENGLFPNETTPELPPPAVKEAKAFIEEFVLEWLEAWKSEKSMKA